MPDHDLRPWRLTMVALLGAALLEAVLMFSTGVLGVFTVRQIPNHLAALVVGALLGWIYELFRELHATTRASLRELGVLSASVDGLTSKIRYQDQALSTLMRCPRHNEVLTALIQASMSDNFKNIPFIGVAEYLGFLAKAIQHSAGYQGVQRRPLRWYQKEGAGAYLEDLREKPMKFKTRLIILEDSDARLMSEDLKDQRLLDFYWRHTGEVETFWMTSAEFRECFPSVSVPRDFALYDHALLIAYDEARQVLTFDVLDGDRPESHIFDLLRQLVSRGSSIPKRVPSTIESITEQGQSL